MHFADAQHKLVVKQPGKRGLFYSNTSVQPGHPAELQPLVMNVAKYHLHIDPASIPASYQADVFASLARFLSLSREQMERLAKEIQKNSRDRKIAKWVENEKKEQIQNWWKAFAKKRKLPSNALYFEEDFKRCYPYGKLLGQVLHTVGERDEKTDKVPPSGGLELYFNSYLMGKNGKKLFLRSPRRSMESDKVLAEPVNGADVYLTINHYLQAIAEEEIATAVEKAEAKSGWAILMHPRTGAILALAQYPFFDPSKIQEFFKSPDMVDKTKVKAITDPFEPGSVMKPVSLAICLLANEELKKRGKAPIFNPSDKRETRKGNFPGRSRPIHDVKPHSFLNMYMAVQKSSNIYVARLIQRVIEELGTDWYRTQLHDVFGFGERTGIELPSESPGLLPTPGKTYPNGRLEWSVPTPFSLAMGHNILVNSLQMMRCFAIIANGGYDVKPTLVRKISRKLSDGGEEIILDRTKNASEKRRLLPAHISQELIKAMKFATKPGGSASRAEIVGYTEAGKTATSEKIVDGAYSKKDHISTFIGFAPASDPQFVLMIVIDEPKKKYIPGIGSNQFGGICAAPAFAKIGLKTLQYLGVPPDDPFSYPTKDKRTNQKKGDWVKEVEELKSLLNSWNH